MADVGGQQGGHAPQQHVPLRVAEAVVVGLEAVEVAHQQAEGLAVAQAARQLALEHVLEVPAVVEPRQPVGDGQGLERAVGVGQLAVGPGQVVAGLLESQARLADAARHLVEGLGQLRDLVAAAHGQAHVGLAVAHTLGGRGEQQDRPQHAPHRQVRQQQHHGGAEQAEKGQATAHVGQRGVGRLGRQRGHDVAGQGPLERAEAEQGPPHVGDRPLMDGLARLAQLLQGGREEGRPWGRREPPQLQADAALGVQQPEPHALVARGQQALELVEVEATCQEAHHLVVAPLDRLHQPPGGPPLDPLGGAEHGPLEGLGPRRRALEQLGEPGRERLGTRAHEHPPAGIEHGKRLVGRVVRQERAQELAHLRVGARGHGLAAPQRLERLEQHERGRPALDLLLALPGPLVEDGGPPVDLVGQPLAAALEQQGVVLLQEVGPGEQDRQAHAGQHQRQDLGLEPQPERSPGRAGRVVGAAGQGRHPQEGIEG